MKKEVKQEILKDPRFSHVLRDPRFKPLRKEQIKVKVDKRFESMFHDKKFQVKSKIDKRGRPVPINSSEDLKRFYELSSESNSSDESEDEDEGEGEGKSKNKKSYDEGEGKSKNKKSSDEESKSDIESESSDQVEEEESGSEELENEKEEEEQKIKLTKDDEKYLTPEIKEKLQDLSIDYARGQDILYSDSSSGDESSEEEDQELGHDWGELDKDAGTTEEATSRLAICNMDWDRAKAVDLMVLFHSFLPAGGLIHSVTVYPSEFGLQKMKEEEEKGPTELREIKDEDEEGKVSEAAMEKLRIYQLNRLKYFYAVVVCDTPDTANSLYKACDGLEYECSSNKLDLRFVPEDMTFEQVPRETCTSLPDLSTYKPRLFQTKALTHSKAELTWDETDPDRQDVVKLAHSGNIREDQLKMYLACSSSEGENESEDEEEREKVEAQEEKNEEESEEQLSEKGRLDKYKALLAEIESKEKKNNKNKIDLEVTWNLSLEQKASKMVKEKMKDKESLTPFQQFLEKRKEKRKKRREEKKKKHEEDQAPESGDSVFSDDEIPSDIDMNDPYFKEEMEQYKKKKKKSKKKVEEEEEEEEEDDEKKTKKAQLELLMLDKDEHEGKHFNMKKIMENEQESKTKKKKKLKKKDQIKESKKPIDDFQVDVNDERFSAIYSSHHFNIDPADPNFKVTQGTKALIEEKLKRRAFDDPVLEESTPKIFKTSENGKKKNAELSVLVKTIKRKTNEAQNRLKR